MYILCLFEAVYISHDLSLEKKGLECNVLLWKQMYKTKPLLIL